MTDPSGITALLDESPPIRNYEADVETIESTVEAQLDGKNCRDSLLRFKRRAWMQIVATDLSGEASVAKCTDLYSKIAETCIRLAWRHLAGESPVSVVALGKLGGSELNYSSDVDLVFVSGDAAAHDDMEARVKSFIAFLNGEVAAERMFLVDPDLRPEGRSGPLVRSLSSYEQYWRRWAEPWEIQALIKARPLAGPEDVSRTFSALASRFLWPEVLDPEAIKSIRQIRRRTEVHIARTARSFDIKRSQGGIRDVEMAVQLLQLIHGRHDPSLRFANTFEAVAALRDGGYISEDDAGVLLQSYVLLRTIEHLLQIKNDTARYELPTSRSELRVLAKAGGFSDSKSASAEELFEAEFTRVTSAVRRLHERLFFRPMLEAFATLPKASTLESPAAEGLPEEIVEERLRALGFKNTRQARIGLSELTKGISRRSRLMAQLMPLVLEWLSESPDPSGGLTNLRNLVAAVGDQVVLVSTFRENATAVQRICRVLGTSRVLAELLIKNPEGIHAFADDKELFRTKRREELVKEAESHTAWRSGYDQRLEGILRFCNREFLRTATRDILSGDRSEVEKVAEELSGISEGALVCAVEAAISELGAEGISFCVVGLGSFGAIEMAYSSDIDVMFLFDVPPDSGPKEQSEISEMANRIASRLINDLRGLGVPGTGFNLDADLRPEGRSGILARSLSSAIAYYERWADTWEFQALAKARAVAGEVSIFERLIDALEDRIWPASFPDSRVREIRLMKARVERERAGNQETRRFHLKLGPGGLTDVQFLVELYALVLGAKQRELRHGSTLTRLRKLAEIGVFSEEDRLRLEEAYLFCSQIRNRMFLIKGRQYDVIPQRPEDAIVLAESIGYLGHPRFHLLEDYRRITRRARATFERLFYADPAEPSS